MGDVTVLVLHPPLPPGAGPLCAALDEARRGLAAHHVAAFLAAGAATARVVEEQDDVVFGARLRRLVAGLRTSGAVVLGSGALALAGEADYRDLVAAAASDVPRALANNRFSSDAIAVAGAAILRNVPDLPADNALPRWLEEVAGYPVEDLRRRRRLGVDLDSPGDLVLLGRPLPPDAAGASPLPQRLAAVRAVLADRRAEVTVAGRTSAGTLAVLERRAACRVRALVEERGLRASSLLAMAAPAGREARPPSTTLGLLLDLAGPGALGRFLARLGDAAVVDTRVLLAHRLGADERRWPEPEDRFASDLLLAGRVRDPWLRDLTAAAVGAPIPILLGGHTLVGPGLPLLTGGR
jgi:hypothetical protein